MALIWSAFFAKSLVPAPFMSHSIGGDAAQDSNKHQLKVESSMSYFLWMAVQDKSCAKFDKYIYRPFQSFGCFFYTERNNHNKEHYINLTTTVQFFLGMI